MKITVKKLQGLIKNLDKSEKRALKLLAQTYAHQRSSKYIELFDYLDKNYPVDLDAYKKNFREVSNLTALQRYLFQLIMKMLRQKRAENIEQQLLEGLQEVEILYTKKLYELSNEKLMLLHDLAVNHQYLFFLPYIYNWIFRIENTRTQYRQTSFNCFYELMDQYQKSTSNLDEYISMHLALIELIYQSQRSSRQLSDASNFRYLSASIDKKLSNFNMIPSKVIFLQLQSYYYYLLRQNQAAKGYYIMLYNYLKSLDKSIQKEYEHVYMASIAGVIENAEDITETDYYLQEGLLALENISHRLVPIQRYRAFFTLIQHRLLLQKQDYENVITFGEKWSQEKHQLGYSNRFYHRYYLVLACFMLNRYEEALQWLDTFPNEANHDIQTTAIRLLNIIILYEKDEAFLLPYLIKNTKRKLKKMGILFDFERLFLNFIDRVIKYPQKERISLFRKFKIELEQFIRPLDSHDKEFLLLFNFGAWIDKHAYNKPMEDACIWYLQ